MPGYEYKFVHPLLKRHECPICHHAMRNPMQTECGHRFCKDCLEPILNERHPICPLDKEEISHDKIFLDNTCRNEILNLDVHCPFLASGCGWIAELRNLDVHVDMCDYRDVQCTLCGQYLQLLTLSKHKETECPMRPQQCSHFGEDVPVQQMQFYTREDQPSGRLTPQMFPPPSDSACPEELVQLSTHYPEPIDEDVKKTHIKTRIATLKECANYHRQRVQAIEEETSKAKQKLDRVNHLLNSLHH